MSIKIQAWIYIIVNFNTIEALSHYNIVPIQPNNYLPRFCSGSTYL